MASSRLINKKPNPYSRITCHQHQADLEYFIEWVFTPIEINYWLYVVRTPRVTQNDKDIWHPCYWWIWILTWERTKSVCSLYLVSRWIKTVVTNPMCSRSQTWQDFRYCSSIAAILKHWHIRMMSIYLLPDAYIRYSPVTHISETKMRVKCLSYISNHTMTYLVHQSL